MIVCQSQKRDAGLVPGRVEGFTTTAERMTRAGSVVGAGARKDVNDIPIEVLIKKNVAGLRESFYNARRFLVCGL